MSLSISSSPEVQIGSRKVGLKYPPLVIAEIGINHEGSMEKAVKMVEDAYKAGCECVKFQCHILEDEMIPNKVIPGNARESIWDIMNRCQLTESQEEELKKLVEAKKMIYLNTPFSRAAANRLQKMGVQAFKIGSGECNNYPLIEHIAKMGKPILMSTGMNDLASINPSVEILRKYRIPFALFHCTSIYPTPYEKIRLGALHKIQEAFPDAITGLSDHSLSNYPCLASVALGARLLERHFTSDKSWAGPDIPISMDPKELKELIEGSNIIFRCLGGTKSLLPEEQPTIDFAYACIVTLKDLRKGDCLSEKNIWAKRPGTGEIKAKHYFSLLGKRLKQNVNKDRQLKWSDLEN